MQVEESEKLRNHSHTDTYFPVDRDTDGAGCNHIHSAVPVQCPAVILSMNTGFIDSKNDIFFGDDPSLHIYVFQNGPKITDSSDRNDIDCCSALATISPIKYLQETSTAPFSFLLRKPPGMTL